MTIDWTRARRIDLVAALLGCLTILAVGLHAPVPLRAVLTFSFSGLCPGLVATSGFAPKDRLERIVIAIGLSLALDTILTELMAMGHVYTALTALIVLLALIAAKIGIGVLGFPEWLQAHQHVGVLGLLAGREGPAATPASVIIDRHMRRRTRPWHDRPRRV